MKTRTAVLISIAMLSANWGYSYSHDGHYLVGAIADQMLAGTPAASKVKKLIGNITLARAATLPDEIKEWDPGMSNFGTPVDLTTNQKLNSDLQAFVEANRTKPDCSGELLHHEYHFADIQIFTSSSYSEGQIGASTHDIVHMIPFCIDVLTGKQSADNAQKITPAIALVLLVHYVGDLHQPLHVGAEYFDSNGQPADPNKTTPAAADKGGNALSLVLPSLPDRHGMHPGNLHHYWDEKAVEIATNKWARQISPSNPRSVTLDAMAKSLKKSLPAGWTAEPTIDPATFATDCANEILPIAQAAHKRLTFSGITDNNHGACLQVKGGTATAPDDYPTFAAGVVADEIQKGGHRLADLLQTILK